MNGYGDWGMSVQTWLPGAVAESVEHGSSMWVIVGSNPWSSQTNDLSNWFFSLSSQMFDIIRIGGGLGGSMLG